MENNIDLLLAHYKERWAGSLIQATSEGLEPLALPEEEKTFLTAIGFPTTSCLYFHFSTLQTLVIPIDADFITTKAAKTEDVPRLTRKYRELYRLAEGDAGPDLAIHKTTGELYALNYGENGFPDLYVSRSPRILACILQLLYSDYFDLPDNDALGVTKTRAIARTLRKKIAELDSPAATKRHSYWPIWLEEIGEGVI